MKQVEESYVMLCGVACKGEKKEIVYRSERKSLKYTKISIKK